MPKVGGKLYNIKHPKGVIADANQIEIPGSEKTLSDTISEFDERVSVVEKSGGGIKKFVDLADAEAVLGLEDGLNLGEMCSVYSGSNEDEGYLKDYKVYLVVEGENKQLKLKELSGGAGSYTGTITFDVGELLVDGVAVDATPNSTIEANIGSVIEFKYTFFSEMQQSVYGKVILKRRTDTIVSEKVYPDNTPRSIIYKADNLEPGNYRFQIYGTDSTGRPSAIITYNFLIGGLTVKSTFDDSKTFIAGNRIDIPLNVSAADTEAEITAHMTSNGEEVFTKEVSNGINTLLIEPGTIGIGVNRVKIWLSNSKGKLSNELEYDIIIAEPGIIYVIPDREIYSTAEGTKVDMLLRVIQVGEEESTFPSDMTILDKNNEIVRTQKFNFGYGENLVSLINLKHTDDNADFTEYTAKFIVALKDNSEITPAEIEVKIQITKNNYNIALKGRENLLCEFVAAGKNNSDESREIWEDTSGKNVSAKLSNFNWQTNGWLPDDDGNTALTLNSGAYVEIDIAPFAEDIKEDEAITISIDYSTKDILDSNAKVISCLEESAGDESISYYLRDNLGEYVEKGDENITNFFKNNGGYCWVDGITYDADAQTEYNTTTVVSNRALNLNMGDENPEYDAENGPFNRFIGTSRQEVIKQTGFYIDTQYAVLSHSASLSNVMDKFYLNFSEDTRTRIDFIITRNKSTDPDVNPYCFKAMVGYTNGVLSLMKVLNDNESFKQADIKGNTFKIYLGGKGQYDQYQNLTVSETGSSKIYSFRMFNRALTPKEVLNNYAAEIPNFEKKKQVIDNNGIINVDSIAQLPQMCLIGYTYQSSQSGENNTIKKFIMQLKQNDMPVSDLKKIKEPAYLTYTNPMDDNKSWYYDKDGVKTNLIPIRLQFQGTSSMVYPVKNYKFKMYKYFTEDTTNGKIEYSKDKIKFDIGNGVSENTFCLKAD